MPECPGHLAVAHQQPAYHRRCRGRCRRPGQPGRSRTAFPVSIRPGRSTGSGTDRRSAWHQPGAVPPLQSLPPYRRGVSRRPGFGFIRRVPRENAATFTESARADGWPGFRIKELTPHQYEHYVIQYVEPVDRNDEAVGLDIGSELNRRTAADDAIATGQVRITGPITLVQATGNPLQSFLILMPIYEGGDTPNTLAERRAKAFGWSYAPLLMQEVLADRNWIPMPFIWPCGM
ncbi:CHASE domain-containing protein [Oceanimonas sp. NS1]|nr:CHASE domain-containing protein [Oceanimonas sp. NS1]